MNDSSKTRQEAATESAAEQENVRFVLQLGAALHRYGTPAHRIEDAMAAVSRQLGITTQVLAMPTGILAAQGEPARGRTSLIRMAPGGMDLARLCEVDKVADNVISMKMTPQEGALELERIHTRPPHYGTTVTLLCWGLASATAALFFGGGLNEALVSAALGLMLGVFATGAEKWPGVARLFEPVAAFGAALLSVIGTRFIGGYSAEVATLATLVFLLPGLMLVMSVTELSTRHLISGTTRLTTAALIFLQLAFGVALGSRIEILLPPATPYAITELPGWTMAPTLVLITIALAVLFRARMRDCGHILIAALIAYTGGNIGARVFGPQLGAFVGATALGVASNGFARLFNIPASVTLVPGVMLLVPGAIGFRSLEAMMTADIVQGIQSAFLAIMVVVAIVAGTLFANELLPPRRVL